MTDIGRLTEHAGLLDESTAPALAHGVNIRGQMGAGIAVWFRETWPAMYLDYKGVCEHGELPPGGMMAWRDTVSGRWIYNIASQRNPGRDARIDWLITGASRAVGHARNHGVTAIAMPRIGCGIGGLDWVDVRFSLETVARAGGVDIDIWTPIAAP